MNRAWKEEDDKILRDMREQGFQYKQISLLVGHPTGACVNRMMRLLARDARPDMPSPGKPWTREDDDVLRSMRDAGVTFREISAVLGRTLNACTCRAKKMGERNWDGNYPAPDLRDLSSLIEERTEILDLAMSRPWTTTLQPEIWEDMR